MTDRTLIDEVITAGHGAICVGNGRMVIYGAREIHRAGVAWISNTVPADQAKALLTDAVQQLAEDARRASKAKDKRLVELVPGLE